MSLWAALQRVLVQLSGESQGQARRRQRLVPERCPHGAEAGIVRLPREPAAGGSPAIDNPPWRLLEERRLDPYRPSVGTCQRTTDFRVSPTDPDAAPMRIGTATILGYHDHYVVDGGKQRIILAALVTPADVMENVPKRDLLWRV